MYHFSSNFAGTKLMMDLPIMDLVFKAAKYFYFALGASIVLQIREFSAGMMVQFLKYIHFPNDQWYQVTGAVDMVYYPEFKSKIPVIMVSSYKSIPQPKNPCVYRNGLN